MVKPCIEVGRIFLCNDHIKDVKREVKPPAPTKLTKEKHGVKRGFI